jgi:hypothetical protein
MQSIHADHALRYRNPPNNLVPLVDEGIRTFETPSPDAGYSGELARSDQGSAEALLNGANPGSGHTGLGCFEQTLTEESQSKGESRTFK